MRHGRGHILACTSRRFGKVLPFIEAFAYPFVLRTFYGILVQLPLADMDGAVDKTDGKSI